MEKPTNDGSHSEELFSHRKSTPMKERLPWYASDSQFRRYSHHYVTKSNFLIFGCHVCPKYILSELNAVFFQ
jgi:hypothetical protein